MSNTLYAGAARRVINPPLGTGKVGFRLFGGPVQAIESDLTATAVVLSNVQTKIVIIGIDLGNFELDLDITRRQPAQEVRARIAQALEIPISHVLLNLSHTHGSPVPPGYIPDAPEELELKERAFRDAANGIFDAAIEASQKLQAARIGAGWGECHIAVYRREFRDGRDVLGEVPDHPIDPSVGVIRVDDLEGKPIAVLFRYSCHPAIVGGRSQVASSDFPGAARRVLEENLGGLALFLQGCAGNINPRYGIGYEVDCRDIKNRAGMMLGGEALKVAANIRTNRRPGTRKPLGSVPNILFTPWEPVSGDTCTYLGAAEHAITLDYGELPSLQQAEAVLAHWQHELTDRRARDAQDWQIRVAEKNEQWGRVLVDAVKQGHPTCQLWLHAARMNDILITGMNCETFFETGLTIKAQSPFKDTFVLGYTDGTIGYLPRAEDYPAGGWKYDASYAVPDLLFQWLPHPVALRPDSEQRAIEGTVGLIKQLSA